VAPSRATVETADQPSLRPPDIAVDDTRTFTVPEAARILGRTPDAIRGLVRRGTLNASRGNDGRPRVILPAGDATIATVARPSFSDMRETVATVVTPGRDDILNDLRERLAKAEAKAVDLQSELDRLMEQRAQTRERAAKAEGEAVALREALADLATRLDATSAELRELRRPWLLRVLEAIRR
jgi:hypothetical protein